MILQKKKVRLVNHVTSRRKPDYSSRIYLTDARVAQYRLVAGNKREKEEAKNKTAKNTATRKLYLKKN